MILVYQVLVVVIATLVCLRCVSLVFLPPNCTVLLFNATTIGKYIFGIILVNFSIQHYTRQHFYVYLQFSHHKYSNNLQLVSLGFCRLHRKLDCQDTLTSEGPNIYCPIQLCNTKHLFQQIHPQYLECHF